MFYQGIVILRLKKLPIQRINIVNTNSKFMNHTLNKYLRFNECKHQVNKLNRILNILSMKKSKFSNLIALVMKKPSILTFDFFLLIKLICTHYFLINKYNQSYSYLIILLSNKLLIKILVKELALSLL
mmetsp:Transcript_7656/g.10508  ORF Transcript_7656/g.10508 Transcript_7656/m.10508 type:complete len:128 (-) Transcript_7656:85-468(-)